MKFTPLKFQGTLAAAGVALMPYIFLMVNIFKSDAGIAFADLANLSGGMTEQAAAWFLVGVMGLFIIIHFSLTALFLKELFAWLSDPRHLLELVKNPILNAAVFSPFISLSMSMLVFFGPVAFFIPWLTENMQMLMGPAFMLFCLLWFITMFLEAVCLGVFFKSAIDYSKLHFGWLLDILALGAVSLFGSSIASSATNGWIASVSALMVTMAVFAGGGVFAMKLAILLYQQLKTRTLPGNNILPAYFLVIPPMCLLGFSSFKLLGYADKTYSVDASTMSFTVMVSSYFTAMAWFVVTVFLLRKYFEKDFLASEFSPAQWGMV